MTELVQAEDEGDRLTPARASDARGRGLERRHRHDPQPARRGPAALREYPDQWAAVPVSAADGARRGRRSDALLARRSSALPEPTGEDVDLLGVELPAGTLVSVNTAAANRDPAMYEEPDRFDIKRTGAPPHLTFGGGIHYCLGVHLAKAELAEALVQMRAKWPTIELDSPRPGSR